MILVHDYLPGIMHRYAQKYLDILKFNNIPYEIVNCHNPNFWKEIQDAELLIYYIGTDNIHLMQLKSVLNIINSELNVHCYPNYQTSWHLDDKVSQYYLLKSKDFPVVQSWIFWDKNLALEFVHKAEFPLIFKLKGGAGSLNVSRVTTVQQGERLIKLMFGKGIKAGGIPGVKKTVIFNSDVKRVIKDSIIRTMADLGLRNKPCHAFTVESGYVLFQKYLANNAHDTRVTIIGNRAFAFRRFNRPNDFRSSGSGLIDYDETKIDLKTVKIAFQVSKNFGFQTMAFDFLKDGDNNYKIVEICHLFADWAIYNCPGYWDEKLIWHEGHFWPQYSELINLLGNPNLIQPEFTIYQGRDNLSPTI